MPRERSISASTIEASTPVMLVVKILASIPQNPFRKPSPSVYFARAHFLIRPAVQNLHDRDAVVEIINYAQAPVVLLYAEEVREVEPHGLAQNHPVHPAVRHYKNAFAGKGRNNAPHGRHHAKPQVLERFSAEDLLFG